MTQTTGCWLFPKIWNVSDKKCSSREADKLNLDPVSADWKFSDFKVGVSAHFDVKSKFRARELRFGPQIAFLMGNSTAASFLPFWGKKHIFRQFWKTPIFQPFSPYSFFSANFGPIGMKFGPRVEFSLGISTAASFPPEKKNFSKKRCNFDFSFMECLILCAEYRGYMSNTQYSFFFCQKLLQPFLVRLGLKLGSIACYGMGRTSEGSKST